LFIAIWTAASGGTIGTSPTPRVRGVWDEMSRGQDDQQMRQTEFNEGIDSDRNLLLNSAAVMGGAGIECPRY